MVNSNEGIPNQVNCNVETLSSNTHHILGTDSDTDQEETGPDGYQPLSMNGDYNEDDNAFDTSDTESEISQEEFTDTVPSTTTAENDLLKELWSDNRSIVDINMDSQKVEEVKQAMVNITLPPTSIPEWANNIPEEQWKQHLFNRLRKLT